MPWNIIADKWFSAATGVVVTDMSAAGKSVTAWYSSSKIGELMSMTPVWPATGEPVGVLTLEQTNDPDAVATSDGDEVDLSPYYTEADPEPNPDGSAGRKPVLVPAAGLKFRWAYARTSGGEGAVCTVYGSGG